MTNYIEWKNEFGDIIVQVFNECDLPDVQKHYIEKGYYIKETMYGLDNSYFFKIYSVDMGEQKNESNINVN